MMRIKSARYVACHEAGHAIVAVNNGYHIYCIRLSRCPNTGDWNGVTYYSPESWKCAICEMEISSRHDPTELQLLKDECLSCSAEKWRFVERCFAGGAATSTLAMIVIATEYRSGEFTHHVRTNEKRPSEKGANEQKLKSTDSRQQLHTLWIIWKGLPAPQIRLS